LRTGLRDAASKLQPAQSSLRRDAMQETQSAME